MILRTPFLLSATLLMLFAPRFVQAQQWVRTHGPYAGNAAFLATNSTYLFAGIVGGGMYRSSDKGTSWEEINSGLTNYGIRALALNDANLIVATYDRCFRSTNNGDSWSETAPLADKYVESLAFSGAAVVAATASGVFRSTDNGDSWMEARAGMEADQSARLLTRSGSDLFAGTHTRDLYRSSDHGAHWTQVNIGGPAFVFQGCVRIDTLLVAGSLNGGVYRSSDNGTTWSNAGLEIPNGIVYGIAVSGTELFLGTRNGVYRSSDYGRSWIAASTGLHYPLLHGIIAHDTGIFAGTSEGIYRSTDHGGHWATANNLMNASQIYSLAVRGTTIFAGTSGGRVFRSTDDGTSWIADNEELIQWLPIEALLVRGEYLFAGSYNGVSRSTDNGEHWTRVNEGLVDSNILVLAASNEYLFAGTASGGGLYRSADNGEHWERVLPTGFVTQLMVRGQDVFAVTENGLFRSTNNGELWAPANGNLPHHFVRGLADNGSYLLVTIWSGVYRSSDNGDSWSQVTTNSVDLANSLVGASATAIGTEFFLSVIVNDSNYDAVYTSILHSSDNGANWSTISEGGAVGGSSVLAATSTYLFAGSGGSGVWRRLLSEISSVQTPAPVSTVSGDVDLYPNPVISSMIINYQLDAHTPVTITIHDALGRIVTQPVVNAMQEAGEHEIALTTDNLASGVYLCSVNAGGVERAVRFVVVR